MPELELVVKIGIYAVMAVTLVGALVAILAPNLLHAALGLVAVLFGAAGIFLSVKAEFLAVIQILLYVGAVMTLVIFAIMLTSRFGDTGIRQHNRLGLLALIVASALFAVLSELMMRTPWPIRERTLEKTVSLSDLAHALMGRYVFPFEIIAVLLTAALVGAIVVARKEKSS